MLSGCRKLCIADSRYTVALSDTGARLSSCAFDNRLRGSIPAKSNEGSRSEMDTNSRGTNQMLNGSPDVVRRQLTLPSDSTPFEQAINANSGASC